MQAAVYRLLQQGRTIDRDYLRATRPARGDLRLRLRITGRGAEWDIFLATLEQPGGTYVIPCLDRAKVIEIRGHWLHLRGVEINPRGASVKRLASDNFKQEWWCKVEGAVGQVVPSRTARQCK